MVQNALGANQEPGLNQGAHSRTTGLPEDSLLGVDQQTIIQIVSTLCSTRARAVRQKYGLYFQPKGRRSSSTAGRPGPGRNQKIIPAPAGRRKEQKAFLRSICTGKRGCAGGILDRARPKSSQESSLKVGGTDPSPLFYLLQLRIRENFSEDLGITKG